MLSDKYHNARPLSIFLYRPREIHPPKIYPPIRPILMALANHMNLFITIILRNLYSYISINHGYWGLVHWEHWFCNDEGLGRSFASVSIEPQPDWGAEDVRLCQRLRPDDGRSENLALERLCTKDIDNYMEIWYNYLQWQSQLLDHIDGIGSFGFVFDRMTRP